MVIKDNMEQWEVAEYEYAADVVVGAYKAWQHTRPRMNQIVNKYPNPIAGLSHKDTFHKIIQFAEHFDPDPFDFIPRTFLFPEDIQKFLNYQRIVGKNTVFVAKPCNKCLG